MENCRNVLISLARRVERFYGKHRWNPVSQFREEDSERCTVLLYLHVER